MKETIGEYIHRLRVEGSMTLTKLAAALDIDQSTLSKIENGKRLVPENILPKLAKVFELKLGDLRKEYYSERIAEIIYPQSDTVELLKLAEEKVKYFRAKQTKQGKLDFEKQ